TRDRSFPRYDSYHPTVSTTDHTVREEWVGLRRHDGGGFHDRGYAAAPSAGVPGTGGPDPPGVRRAPAQQPHRTRRRSGPGHDPGNKAPSDRGPEAPGR